MRVKYAFSMRRAQKNRKPDTNNQHRVAYPKLAMEVIRTSDIILEVLDVRYIDKTRNEFLEKEAKKLGKRLIFILNKADLVSVNELKMNYDLTQIQPYVLFSSKNKVGRRRLRDLIKIEASKVKGVQRVRVGIIGYPNTGKSSLLNALSGRASAGTSSQSGFTKGIQKIRFNERILILDSPGVIPVGEGNRADSEAIKKQTEVGVRNFERVKEPDFVLKQLMEENPGVFEKTYGIEAEGDVEILLDELGKKWNFLRKGGKVDIDRTARRVLRDWQEGKVRKKFSK